MIVIILPSRVKMRYPRGLLPKTSLGWSPLPRIWRVKFFSFQTPMRSSTLPLSSSMAMAGNASIIAATAMAGASRMAPPPESRVCRLLALPGRHADFVGERDRSGLRRRRDVAGNGADYASRRRRAGTADGPDALDAEP